MVEDDTILDDSNPERELVSGSPTKRNWRGIGVALLVIMIICALIIAAVLIIAPNGKATHGTGTPFNLSEIVSPPVLPDNPNPTWLNAHVLAYKDENKTLWTLDLTESIGDQPFLKKQLMSSEDFVNYPKAWIPSPDGKYVALKYTKHARFRHSSTFTVTVHKVFNGSSISHKSIDNEKPVKLFKWAPSSFPAAFVFVDENNDIWYQKDAFNDSSSIRVTNTGSQDVYNGISDWLYEEEIFQTDCALSFSDTGSKLAYYTINDTAVKKIRFDYYSDNDNYPNPVSIPYPKVGETIPVITVYVWTVLKQKTIRLNPPAEVTSLKEFYLIDGHWLKTVEDNRETFATIWSNRVQNTSFISTCVIPNDLTKANSVNCTLHYKHSYTRNWLDPSTTSLKFSSNDKYFTLLPKNDTDGYSYIHIASLSTNTDSLQIPRFITSGQWEISNIVGFDDKRQILYFLAARPTPAAKHLYRVNVASDSINQNPECLTCFLAKNECNHVEADFSDSALYYVLTCKGPGVPKIHLRSTANNSTIFLLSNNTEYAAYLGTKSMPVIKYDSIDLDNGYTALLKLLLPPNFDQSGISATYPVVLRVYAGPESQMVLDTFSVNFDTYLVSQRKFIIAYVDARGSGNRGTKYTTPIYRNFGTVEIEDQINAMRLFENRTNYVNRNKLAVWGWSYGGFATAQIVKHDKFQTFKCAASVAPVTNFLYYDTAYTERYMGINTTDDNYDGYKRTNIMSDVSAFALGKYLLAHGTGDDNVHFQNSAMLVEALTKLNIQFKFMAYTNQQHSIADNLLHLYTMLDNFLLDCFHMKIPDEAQ